MGVPRGLQLGMEITPLSISLSCKMRSGIYVLAILEIID